MTELQNFIISHAAVNKMKLLVPRLSLRSDDEVREYIRNVINDADLDTKSEEFWENDLEHGTQKNLVIELSIHQGGHYGPFTTFAIIKETVDGPIVVTFISRQARDAAISERWSTLPPEARRTRKSTSESINKPFEKLAEEGIEVKKPDYVISYVDEGEEVMFVGPTRTYKEPLECIDYLLRKGIQLSTITVWERKHVEVNLKVDVKGL